MSGVGELDARPGGASGALAATGVLAGPAARPLSDRAPGVYLHVPFCSAICPYCDFSVLVGDGERRSRFVDALVAEIGLWAGTDLGRPFDTVYLGGGTPSILEPEQLGRILGALAERLPLAPEPLVTLEANPEDVTRERLAAWRALGVGALSLGVQSFDADALRFLGRRHGPEDSRRALERALAAGFRTVSIDLIYGLPGQGLERWRRDLDAAIDLAPDHLSCYQLTVHRKTVFGHRKARGELAELPDEEQAAMFFETHERLAAAGWQGYEVSNFARSAEHRSRHNSKYWDHTPYLGLGPSAHSFAGRCRWWNHEKTGPWERAVAAGERPLADWEDLSDVDLALERLMLGLRTPEGIDLDLLAERYGVELEAGNGNVIEELSARSLLTAQDRHLRPTLAGLAVADTLAGAFDLEP